MEETVITKGSKVKEECNISLDFEEIEDISKVEKSSEIDDSVVKGESNEECQNDISDETNVTGGYVNKFNVGLTIEEVSKVETSWKIYKLKVKIESNEKCQFDISDWTVITEGCIFKDLCNDGY